MVEFFPTLDEIKTLHPQPTKGEWALLNFLNDYLKKFPYEPFEVYYQPHWDGSLPDVVIMRKNHGVLIIEVKDWNLDLYKINDNYNWTCLKPQGNTEPQNIKSPIAQAKYYKNLFYNTYSRTLAEKNFFNDKTYSLVESAVFFYVPSKDKVKNFFGDYAKEEKKVLSSDYITLLTSDLLKSNGLENTCNSNYLLKLRSKFFDEEIYNELRRVLKPSEYSKFKNLPKTLNAKQKELVTSKADTKSKVRGPAGCGKTTVLAYRAVDAFVKKRTPVLILTFNITLCNYIRDCISAALNDLPNIENKKRFFMKYFVIKHIHTFLSNYDNVNVPLSYDTILVDEVQDYERGWMDFINKEILNPRGELVFFGDKDQDIYERRQMASIPVRGNWNELKSTYRLRGKIADLARDFQIKFLSTSDNKFEPRQMELTLSEETVEFYPLHKFDIPAIIKIFKDNPVANDDVCIMSLYVKNGRLLDKVLRDMKYKTITTFETEEAHREFKRRCEKSPKLIPDLNKALRDMRRTAKVNFWMESGRIKLSTIHSYKGWGVDTEILLIGDDGTEKESFFDEENGVFKYINSEIIYVAITRAVKKLIIINIGNDRTYDDFFSSWIKNN